MRVEILAIGDELLDGRVADTNTLRLASALAPLGLELAQRTTVRDHVPEIQREVRAVAARGAELCVVSGGLGPTADDLTAEVFAELLGRPLIRDEEQAQRIRARLERLGRTITENQFKQADRPEGAEVIPNPVGTAPGFASIFEGCRFVCVPGVPHEFDRMVADAVCEPLRAGGRGAMPYRTLWSFGLVEAEVDARLTELPRRWPQVRVGFRAHFPEIHVSLSEPGGTDGAALAEAERFARAALHPYVFSDGSASLAERVVADLRARDATVALAESCTGGLVGDMITDVPGASEVFHLDVVAYHNDAKATQLHVPAEVLERHGAVSEPTVLAMARGVRAAANTTFGVGVSGIAGPGGGTPEKPVGTVHMAVVGPEVERTVHARLPFDRRRNKVVTAYRALTLLREVLAAR